MTQIGYHWYRYREAPLQEKVAWFDQAPGATAVEPARASLGTTGNVYVESDDRVCDVLRGIGLDWQGSAATATAEVLHRAADWSGATGAAAGAGGGVVEAYGSSFEETRRNIHWEDPGEWGWDDTALTVLGGAVGYSHLLKVTIDHVVAAEQNRTYNEQAIAALVAHESNARDALGAFPSIEPAAAMTTGAPGAGPAGGGGVSGLPGGPGLATSTSGPDGSAGTAGPGGGLPSRLDPTVPAGLGAVPAASPLTGPGASPLPGTPGAQAPGGLSAPSGGSGSPAGGSGVLPGGSGVLPGGTAMPGATLPGSRAARPGATAPGSRPGGPGRLPGPAYARPGAPGGPGALGTATRWSPAPPGSGSAGGYGRGVSSGGEFGGRLGGGAEPGAGPRSGTAPSTGAATSGAAGTSGGRPGAGSPGGHVPMMGGMGAGAGQGPGEHRTKYWIPSSDAFDVPLPPHTDAVIEGGRDG